MGKNSKGFTIVEVMIVLAIVGMIIMVVLLAVPALKRNSRNHEAKVRANKIYAAAIEYMSVNGGRPPTCTSYPCSSSAAGSSIREISRLAGYRRPADMQLTMWDYPGTTDWLMTGTTYLNIAVGVNCGETSEHSGEGWGHTPVPGNANSIIVVYALETSGDDPNIQCLPG